MLNYNINCCNKKIQKKGDSGKKIGLDVVEHYYFLACHIAQ